MWFGQGLAGVFARVLVGLLGRVAGGLVGRRGHGNILIGAGGALHVIKLAWGTRVSCGACGGRTAPPARAPAPAIRRRQPAPGVVGRRWPPWTPALRRDRKSTRLNPSQ